MSEPKIVSADATLIRWRRAHDLMSVYSSLRTALWGIAAAATLQSVLSNSWVGCLITAVALAICIPVHIVVRRWQALEQKLWSQLVHGTRLP